MRTFAQRKHALQTPVSEVPAPAPLAQLGQPFGAAHEFSRIPMLALRPDGIPAARTPAPPAAHFAHAFSRVRVHRDPPAGAALAATGPGPGSSREPFRGTATLQPPSLGDPVPPGTPQAVYPNYRPAGEDAPFAGGDDCGLTGRFTQIPSGVRPPVLIDADDGGAMLSARFDIIAEFDTNIPCTCACGEYRQYVRGQFKKNGLPQPHPLCAADLSPTTFQEDCYADEEGTVIKYGYRSIPLDWSRYYNPQDQATGCLFRGYDHPGIHGAPGDLLELDLEFIGHLIDTCRGGQVLASATWRFQGKATVP